MSKPTILVTNDDSVHAQGIHHLVNIAKKFGKVIVVAPDSPRSGSAHAITTIFPLRIVQHRKEDNYEEYSVNGTPVDCVKLAIMKVLKGKKPDILLSGINHGSNATVNLIYSGTMAAAIEGCMSGIPSIGYSYNSHSVDIDFTPITEYVHDILEYVIKYGLDARTCLNVNLPACPKNEIKGMKICRQGLGYWNEDFHERKDPHGTPYFWMVGDYVSIDSNEETDNIALEKNYVTVVPITYDMTNHEAIQNLKDNLTPNE